MKSDTSVLPRRLFIAGLATALAGCGNHRQEDNDLALASQEPNPNDKGKFLSYLNDQSTPEEQIYSVRGLSKLDAKKVALPVFQERAIALSNLNPTLGANGKPDAASEGRARARREYIGGLSKFRDWETLASISLNAVNPKARQEAMKAISDRGNTKTLREIVRDSRDPDVTSFGRSLLPVAKPTTQPGLPGPAR